MAVTGVAGAGVMGVGVAQNLAQAGHDVVLIDVSTGTLDRARAEIERNCRASRLFGGPAVDAGEILAAITFAVGPAALAKAEIVVENITEDWDAKRALYRQMDETCRPDTRVVANTPAIP